MDALSEKLVREVCAAPERLAVVVIDMQRDFCSPDGVFGRGGVDISANARIVPLVASFVDQMRRHKALIVWVRQLWSDRYISPAISRRLRRAPERRTLCLAGSPGAELAEGLRAADGDIVVEKYRYSAFHGSSLDQLLRGNGIQTVVLVGTAANGCVDTTARDAAQLEYDVVIAADLVGYTDARLAQAALDNLDRHFAFVCSSADVLAAVGAAAPASGKEA